MFAHARSRGATGIGVLHARAVGVGEAHLSGSEVVGDIALFWAPFTPHCIPHPRVYHDIRRMPSLPRS